MLRADELPAIFPSRKAPSPIIDRRHRLTSQSIFYRPTFLPHNSCNEFLASGNAFDPSSDGRQPMEDQPSLNETPDARHPDSCRGSAIPVVRINKSIRPLAMADQRAGPGRLDRFPRTISGVLPGLLSLPHRGWDEGRA